MSLGVRVALGVAALISLTVLGMMALLTSHERNNFIADRQELLTTVIRSDGTRLGDKINDVRKDALFLAQIPSAKMLASTVTWVNADSREAWSRRMQDLFTAFAQAHHEYFQIRLIGIADGGREVVRVDVHDDRIVVTPQAQLQRKGERDYFQAAIKLKPGEVYLSEINLNQEHGQIMIPHTPTLRVATPVFAPDGSVFGIVVINLDFRYLLQDIASSLPSEVTAHIANPAGDYLLHPEAGRTFGFDLGRRYRWQDDLPGLQLQPGTTADAQTPLQHLSSTGGMVYAVAHPVAIDSLSPERHLLLIYTFPETAAEAHIASVRNRMVIGGTISGLLVLMLLLWLVRRTFAPLGRLTRATEAIAAGRYDVTLPDRGAGELGTLVQSFRAMQERIASRDAQDRAIVDTASDGFWIVDMAGRLLEVNAAYVRLSGHAREDLLTMAVSDLDADLDPEKIQQRMREIERTGNQRFETHHRRKDGTLWPVEVTTAYWPMGGGRVFTFLRDISERKAVELERSEREGRLRSVMDALHSSIAVLNPQGVIIGVNSAWRDFAAANAGSAMLQGGVGLDYLAVCRDAAAADPFAAEALAGLEAVRDNRQLSFTLEYPCHSPATQRWFILSARPLVGAAQGMVITHFDITERKLAESVMQWDREQQAALRRLLETLLEGGSAEETLTRYLGILLSNSWLGIADKGAIFLMEKNGQGLRLAASRNLEPETLTTCAHVPLGHCHCGRAATRNELQYTPCVDRHHETTCIAMDDHGHYHMPLLSQGHAIGVLMLYLTPACPRDARTEAFITSVANILVTYIGRVEAEQALIEHQANLEQRVGQQTAELVENQRRLETIIDNLPQLFFMKDEQGRYTMVNRKYVEETGIDRDRVIGHTDEKIHPPTVAAAIMDIDRRVMSSMVPATFEEYVPHADHSCHDYLTSKAPLVDRQGRVYGLMGSATDITTLKDLQRVANAAKAEAERLAQVKSEFLANMSHEIRTPLNAVLGLARIGMRENQGRKTGQTCAQILESGEHLLGVVNDILDFSKIEAGKLRVEKRPFLLRAALDSVTSLVAARAQAKGLVLSVSLAPDLPDWVEGDSLRLTQILANLLSNAIKFTERGEVRLRVAREGEDIFFRVIDSGIGMNEEQLARLFQPFEQADSSTTRHYGGTGLGLAISQSLAHLMGGGITVDSRIGAGSSFILRLSLPAATGPAHPGQADGATAAHGLRLGGLSVLAVDDVEVNRLILEDLLTHEGAHAIFANDGQQALDRLEETGVSNFDVVLMDVQMPVMDGIEATRRIAVLAPGLPVIGLTAHALAEERDRCLAAGMIEHVTKPIDVNVLVAAILRHARPAGAAKQITFREAPLGMPPSTATATTAGEIDWQALLARFNGRREFVRKLAASVRKHHADTPAKLREATRQGDRGALEFMAHGLKGVSGNLEARRLHEMARAFETAVRNGEDIAAERVDGLAGTLEVVLAELGNFDQHEGEN